MSGTVGGPDYDRLIMWGNAPNGLPGGLLGNLLSNEAITGMVGPEAFARGMLYAQGGHVHDVELDEEAMVVSGRVKGTYRDDYAVSVSLAASRSGATR